MVTFTINGRPSINCIAQDPYCYDIAITGRLVNVTNKAELQMVSEMIFLDSFFDIISNYEKLNDKFNFESVYKMDIEQIITTYTVTNQSVLVDVKEYYRIMNHDDLLIDSKKEEDEEDDDGLIVFLNSHHAQVK